MTQETEIDNELNVPGLIDIVGKIKDNDRASAIDDINDILYTKAADVLGDNKIGIAKSLFNEPSETPTVEPESNETDNGSD
tara:strand:- start:791 stop:1033 length:243 start_codon:yes stop_codon:yes gene_type:complete